MAGRQRTFHYALPKYAVQGVGIAILSGRLSLDMDESRVRGW